MPFAVYILGLAVFAQGTSEFMLSGLLPSVADDLSVTIPQAGLLTSTFAVGMVVGAPVLALLTRHWPRRRTMLGFLAVFAAGHVLGALTGSFPVLLASRVLDALACAGFWAVATGAAVSMVPAGARARAMAVVLGGVTAACVAGVPLGAVLGQLWGWRSAFWAVAALSAASFAAILATVPADRAPAGPHAPAGRELRALVRPPLLVAYLTNALVQGGTFCTFTYLAPLLTDTAGLGEGWVPVALVLFGVGAMAGIAAGGRIADRSPFPLLLGGSAALCVGWTAMALTAGHPVPLLVLVLVQGMLAFGIAPALTARTFLLAGDAPVLAGGFTTAAFNVGNTLGPWLGGVVIGAGLGFRAPVWVTLAMTACGLLLVAAVARRERAAQAQTRAQVDAQAQPQAQAQAQSDGPSTPLVAGEGGQ